MRKNRDKPERKTRRKSSIKTRKKKKYQKGGERMDETDISRVKSILGEMIDLSVFFTEEEQTPLGGGGSGIVYKRTIKGDITTLISSINDTDNEIRTHMLEKLKGYSGMDVAVKEFFEEREYEWFLSLLSYLNTKDIHFEYEVGKLESVNNVIIYGKVGSRYACIQKFYSGVNLESIIDERHGRCYEDIGILTEWTNQLLKQLVALHNGGIAHTDIKPNNIFIECYGGEKQYARLIDFDDCIRININTKQPYDTERILSPSTWMYQPYEILINNYNFKHGRTVSLRLDKIDIYNLGTSICHLLTGLPPIKIEMVHKLLTGLKISEIGETMLYFANDHDAMLTKINECLDSDVSGLEFKKVILPLVSLDVRERDNGIDALNLLNPIEHEPDYSDEENAF